MRRYTLFGITILLGLIAGLYYGWVLSPVRVVDTGPAILRADFQSDYVLMVAEVYRSEQHPERAFQRLEFLGEANPLTFTAAAEDFARNNDFIPQDIALIKLLDAALRAWDPSLEFTPTP